MARPGGFLVSICGGICLLVLACGAQGAWPAVLGPPPVRVHDPCLIEADGTFYVFSTGRGLPIRTSRDLVTWQPAGSVFPATLPAWAKVAVPAAKDLWAPDITRFGGEYRLYYSVSSFGSQRSAIGLAVNTTLNATDPAYRWADRGLVVESAPGRDDFNAIDPNVVLDGAGRPWLSFGSFWGGLQILPLDPANGKRDPAHPVAPQAIARRPGDHAIEAPFVFRKGDWFYLFASTDHCCRGVESDYKVVVGRSREVTGPYLDLDGRSMLAGGGSSLIASAGPVRGPGHNAVVRLDANTDLLVHHYYDAEDRGFPKLQVRRLVWGGDGFPLPGEVVTGISAPPGLDAEATRSHLIDREWNYSTDFLDPKPLRLRGGGIIEADQGNGTWELVGSTLTLRWGADRLAECVLAADGRSFVGRNQRHEVVRGTGRAD